MKNIEVEPDLYQFIASQTQHIGENASQILRRLLAPQMELAKKNAINTEEAEDSVEVDVNTVIEEKVTKTSIPKQVASKPSVNGDLLNKEVLSALKEKKSKVDVFLLLLGEMNKQKAADFGKVLDIKGSNRAYFSADKQTLLDTGKSTNPKQIPGSDFWVVTNNNTQRKADLLCKVATILGFAESDISALGSIL
jgi:negative modulator of initiation of replication